MKHVTTPNMVNQPCVKYGQIKSLRPVYFQHIRSLFVRSTKVYFDQEWSKKKEKPPSWVSHTVWRVFPNRALPLSILSLWLPLLFNSIFFRTFHFHLYGRRGFNFIRDGAKKRDNPTRSFWPTTRRQTPFWIMLITPCARAKILAFVPQPQIFERKTLKWNWGQEQTLQERQGITRLIQVLILKYAEASLVRLVITCLPVRSRPKEEWLKGQERSGQNRAGKAIANLNHQH